MNVVLYTRDFEPITVIDLPMWALKIGESRGCVCVHVTGQIKPGPVEPGSEALQSAFMRVLLEFIPIRMNDKRSWVVVVDNEEYALLLRPAWLPGQRGEINEYERRIKNLSGALLDILGGTMGE